MMFPTRVLKTLSNKFVKHLWKTTIFGLAKKKVVILLTINIIIYIFPHFIQEKWNLVGLTLSPNIHHKLLKTPLHEFLQFWSRNNIKIC